MTANLRIKAPELETLAKDLYKRSVLGPHVCPIVEVILSKQVEKTKTLCLIHGHLRGHSWSECSGWNSGLLKANERFAIILGGPGISPEEFLGSNESLGHDGKFGSARPERALVGSLLLLPATLKIQHQ